MNNAQMAMCFNEWMRKFIEEPHEFMLQFQSVNLHLAEINAGKEPTYGEVCAAYMAKLAEQVPAQ